MKKPRKNKKRRNRKKASSNTNLSWCEEVYSGFSPTRSNAWLWFFISIFMTGFAGNQLFNAVATGSVLNLRVVNTVYLSERPFWFVIVVLVDSIILLFCTGYVGCFLKNRAIFK